MNTHDEDHALMLRVADGDREAYQILVTKYLSLCVRFAERMLGNRQDAEDIAQDTCLKLWRHPLSWKQQSSFSTWMYRVVYNACIDHKRKVIRFSDVELSELRDESLTADELVMEKQQSEYVRVLMQQLPHRQRAALILSYYEGVSNQDAADTLGIPIGALQQLLFRARQNLKTLVVNKYVDNGRGKSNEYIR